MYRAMGIDRDPTDPEAAMPIEQACGSFHDQVAVNAIPAVCAAPAGIANRGELPFVRAPGSVR